MAFKMKGSPMQRNFGIGGPMKKTGNPMTQEQKDVAMANAMGEAEVSGRFDTDPDMEKKMQKAKGEIALIKRSDYATPEAREKDLRRAQKAVDALSNTGYFKAKARHAAIAAENN